MKKFILIIMTLLVSISLFSQGFMSKYTGVQIETILDYSDGVTPGTAQANKALILDALKRIDEIYVDRLGSDTLFIPDSTVGSWKVIKNGGDLSYSFKPLEWIEQQPAGAVDKNWIGSGINATGDKFIVSEYGGRLWTYNGITWTEQQPAGDNNKPWMVSKINADGTKFIAFVYGERLYTYNGITWTDQQPAGAGDKNWTDCDINVDGTKFIACIGGGRLWTYNGISWSEQQPAGDNNIEWQSCAINADGTKFIAVSNPGRIYTYNGSTWTEHQPLGASDRSWYCCDINNDGSKFIVIENGGRMWTYDGSEWIEQRPAGDFNKGWQSCAINADGTKFIVDIYGGRLYTSIDGQWTEMFKVRDIGIIIGSGAPGVDYTIIIDGEDNDFIFTYDEDGNSLGLSGKINFPNNTFITATKFAGGENYDLMKLNIDDNIEYGRPIEIGDITVPVAAGVKTLVNIITDGASAGMEHGIVIMANDTDSLFSVITEDDGASGIQNTLTKSHGNFMIGSGAANIDYTLIFNGETNNYIITYDEDNDFLGFDGNIAIGSNYISNDGDSEGISVDGDGHTTVSNNFTINGNFATPYQQVITVAKSSGDYTSIQSAINSISDATSTKIYTVLVYPGEYDEGITLKNWVDIVAIDPTATKILQEVKDNGVIVNCYIKITIDSDTGSGVYITANSNIVIDGNINCSTGIGDYGIYFNNGNIIINGNISSNTTLSAVSGVTSGSLVVNGNVSATQGHGVKIEGSDITVNGNVSSTGSGKYGIFADFEWYRIEVNGNVSSSQGIAVFVDEPSGDYELFIRNGTITCSYDNAAGHGISTSYPFILQNVKIITTNASANSIYAGSSVDVRCMGVWANADDHVNITQLITGGFTYDTDVE